MSVEIILLVCAIAVGFYMAWNIGANDVANAIGTSVGSGALTLKRAVILAAFLELAGALCVGSEVSETIQKGIFNPEMCLEHPRDLVYGMMASLLAAGMWLQIASYYGWPVSTTHTIVGAVLGFGLIYGGLEAVYWDTVLSIVMSWVISPVMGATISFLFFNLIMRRIFFHRDPLRAAKKLLPFLVFWMVSILSMGTLFNGLKNLDLELSFLDAFFLSCGIALFASIGSALLLTKLQAPPQLEVSNDQQNPRVLHALKKSLKYLSQAKESACGEFHGSVVNVNDEVRHLKESLEQGRIVSRDTSAYSGVEKIFAYLQLLSAASMAFAHGANDVANAIGPLSAIVVVLQTGVVTAKSQMPFWVLALGGTGIVIGLATWGWRVVDTIGKRITELTPSRGFSAELGAATTILFASKMGLPVSTTHTLVGSVLGVGLARGIGALNLNTLRDIVVSWTVTVPAGAGLATVFFFVLKEVFG